MNEFHLHVEEPGRTDMSGIHERGPCGPDGPRIRASRASGSVVPQATDICRIRPGSDAAGADDEAVAFEAVQSADDS